MTATGNLSVEAQVRYTFVRRLLQQDFQPPARVVELGSAPGDQIVGIAQLGYQATSMDIGESADQWGSGEEGRMSRLLADNEIRDIRWNLEEVPYPLADAQFDAVIMTEVYEHLRDYPVQSLHQVRRILRPGGRLYFTTPNSAYIMNRLRALAGRTIATSLDDWIAGIPHARHAREYTFNEIKTLMHHAGLHVVSAESRHFHLSSGRKGAFSCIMKRGLAQLARWRPTLGPSIIVVCERPT